jgi:predicted transcriptional regulator
VGQTPLVRYAERAHPVAAAHPVVVCEDQSGAPVVDANGKVIGIVTEADIISKVNREGLCVADIMSHDVITVGEETAMLFAERNIKRVPVLHNGKLVGIVSRADIVHAVAQGHLVIRPW